MIKMEISLNEEKIELDGDYDVGVIKEHLDSLFKANHLKKTAEGVYVGFGAKDDFAHFGSIILHLKKQDWFMLYVDKWLWNVGGQVEDVAEHYRKKPFMR